MGSREPKYDDHEELETQCQYEPCSDIFAYYPGPGPRPKYCNDLCKSRAGKEREKRKPVGRHGNLNAWGDRLRIVEIHIQGVNFCMDLDNCKEFIKRLKQAVKEAEALDSE